MSGDFLLYGSYGYTGRLIVHHALAAGLRPLLAGRDARTLAAQAAEAGLDHLAFPLDDAAALGAALARVPVVLLAAGPFSRTAAPVVEACLSTGTHYVDITGEISVFEALAGAGTLAEGRGVMLLSGAGYDVVPSDCLAAHLKRRLPSATRLRIAIHGVGGGISRGTAATGVEILAGGGIVRRGGRLVRVPHASREIQVDFGRGPRTATLFPWGDVATAWYSTGIPDFEVYRRLAPAERRVLVAARYLAPLLRVGAVQRFLQSRFRRGAAGPGDEARAEASTIVWGEVTDDADGRAVSRLRTGDAYELTAAATVAAVRKVLAGNAPPGFRTPASAYGADWVLELPDVTREDVE
ncbi:MAG TPA: saccharopine dehydrogenase NADP-binding domain-containing protein [Longimicrobium sp.]|nr:saccharopine dehydrogenase NADP-binding domain-containing protein [Longimicrobium sp.]